MITIAPMTYCQRVGLSTPGFNSSLSGIGIPRKFGRVRCGGRWPLRCRHPKGATPWRRWLSGLVAVERLVDLRVARTAHRRVEVREHPVRIVLPRPDVEIPDVEVVFAMHRLAHPHRGHRVAGIEAIRDDELDAVELVGAVGHPLVQQDLGLVDAERRREIGAIHVVIAHRAMVLVHEAVRHGAWITGGDSGIETLVRPRDRAEAEEIGVCLQVAGGTHGFRPGAGREGERGEQDGYGASGHGRDDLLTVASVTMATRDRCIPWNVVAQRNSPDGEEPPGLRSLPDLSRARTRRPL